MYNDSVQSRLHAESIDRGPTADTTKTT